MLQVVDQPLEKSKIFIVVCLRSNQEYQLMKNYSYSLNYYLRSVEFQYKLYKATNICTISEVNYSFKCSEC